MNNISLKSCIHQMLGDIFYSIGLLVLLLNTLIISKFITIFKLHEWVTKFKKVTNRIPTRNDYRTKEDQGLLLTWSFTLILTGTWFIIGLLSSNWIIFSGVIILNFIFNITSFFIKINNIKIAIGILKYSIIILSVLFLILNRFHFHINMDYIRN